MTDTLARNQALVQDVRDALAANELGALRHLLDGLHPSEIADLLESLPATVREELWVHIDQAVEGDVLAHSNSAVRASLVERMEPQALALVTSRLASDDAADILQDLSPPLRQEVLAAMEDSDRTRVAAVLTYPADSAGGLMNVDAVTVRSDVAVDTVLRYLRLLRSLPPNTDRLMVVERDNRFRGVVRLSDLVTADPRAEITDLLAADETAIPASQPVAEVARLFEQRDLLSAPVVDADSRLVGRITVDDVVDVIREESERSILSAAGLAEEHDLFAPLLRSARQRALWLAVNLATAFLAAWVIGLFEASIGELVALAVLMPVVASMGGIAGGQTLTLVIRGLALGQIGRANARSIMLREMAVGMVNGTLWAVVVGVVAATWFGNRDLGLVIAAAMVVNLFTAAFAGAAIPLLLRRLHIDPALAGGVVLTTVTDVVGFFAFLGLATRFLV